MRSSLSSSSSSSLKETVDAYRSLLVSKCPPFFRTFRFKVILTSVLVTLIVLTISFVIVVRDGSDGQNRNNRANFLDNFDDNSDTSTSTTTTAGTSSTRTKLTLTHSTKHNLNFIGQDILDKVPEYMRKRIICIMEIAKKSHIVHPDRCNRKLVMRWINQLSAPLRNIFRKILTDSYTEDDCNDGSHRCRGFTLPHTTQRPIKTTTTRNPLRIETVTTKRPMTWNDIDRKLRQWCHTICSISPEEGGKACNCDSAPILALDTSRGHFFKPNLRSKFPIRS